MGILLDLLFDEAFNDGCYLPETSLVGVSAEVYIYYYVSCMLSYAMRHRGGHQVILIGSDSDMYLPVFVWRGSVRLVCVAWSTGRASPASEAISDRTEIP
jgi:hypothetical protein